MNNKASAQGINYISNVRDLISSTEKHIKTIDTIRGLKRNRKVFYCRSAATYTQYRPIIDRLLRFNENRKWYQKILTCPIQILARSLVYFSSGYQLLHNSKELIERVEWTQKKVEEDLKKIDDSLTKYVFNTPSHPDTVELLEKAKKLSDYIEEARSGLKLPFKSEKAYKPSFVERIGKKKSTVKVSAKIGRIFRSLIKSSTNTVDCIIRMENSWKESLFKHNLNVQDLKKMMQQNVERKELVPTLEDFEEKIDDLLNKSEDDSKKKGGKGDSGEALGLMANLFNQSNESKAIKMLENQKTDIEDRKEDMKSALDSLKDTLQAIKNFKKPKKASSKHSSSKGKGSQNVPPPPPPMPPMAPPPPPMVPKAPLANAGAVFAQINKIGEGGANFLKQQKKGRIGNAALLKQIRLNKAANAQLISKQQAQKDIVDKKSLLETTDFAGNEKLLLAVELQAARLVLIQRLFPEIFTLQPNIGKLTKGTLEEKAEEIAKQKDEAERLVSERKQELFTKKQKRDPSVKLDDINVDSINFIFPEYYDIDNDQCVTLSNDDLKKYAKVYIQKHDNKLKEIDDEIDDLQDELKKNKKPKKNDHLTKQKNADANLDPAVRSTVSVNEGYLNELKTLINKYNGMKNGITKEDKNGLAEKVHFDHFAGQSFNPDDIDFISNFKKVSGHKKKVNENKEALLKIAADIENRVNKLKTFIGKGVTINSMTDLQNEAQKKIALLRAGKVQTQGGILDQIGNAQKNKVIKTAAYQLPKTYEDIADILAKPYPTQQLEKEVTKLVTALQQVVNSLDPNDDNYQSDPKVIELDKLNCLLKGVQQADIYKSLNYNDCKNNCALDSKDQLLSADEMAKNIKKFKTAFKGYVKG